VRQCAGPALWAGRRRTRVVAHGVQERAERGSALSLSSTGVVMPNRQFFSFRRRKLRKGAALRAWSRAWAPRIPDRVPLGRRVVSLVSSALMVLATAVVMLALPSATADAATASPGLPDVTIHATTTPMTNGGGSAINVTAACPSGSTLFGGGAFLDRSSSAANTPSNGLKLNGTIPSDASGNPVTDGASTPSNWTAVAGFGGQNETGDQATAFANCATGGPTTTVVKVSAPVGPSTGSTPNPTTATCPSGTSLLSGGALGVPATEASFKPIASYPSDAAGNPVADGTTNPDSWSAYGSAGVSAADEQVTAYAVCSTDTTVNVQVARVDAPGPQTGSTFTTTTAPCVAGDRLLGGGVLADQGLNVEPQQGVHLRGSFPSDASGTAVDDGAVNPTSWTGVVQAGGQPTPGTQSSVFAMCATANGVQVPTGAIGGILLTGLVALAFVGYQLNRSLSRRRAARS